MGVLPPFPNFPLFPSFYSTLRQCRVTLSCWESGLPSSPISLFNFNEIVNSDTGGQPSGAALPCEGEYKPRTYPPMYNIVVSGFLVS